MFNKSCKSLLTMSVLAAFLLVFSATSPAQETGEAQKKSTDQSEKQEKSEKKEEKNPVLHNEIVVTATRTEKTLFNAPNPVTVVNQEKIAERAPNNVSELLPEMPGTDIVGVGANQSRPVIRGLRGQRILLLSDGIRLSNARRTQAFGEIPSVIDVAEMERVEVVRGPSSVLYGSEAIGGVINLITRTPDYNRAGTNFSGNLGYRYGTADSQHKGFLNLSGNINNFGLMLSGSYRNSSPYSAPADSFGAITLDKNTPVLDSGVTDYNFSIFMGMRLAENHDISVRYDNYQAKDAGYGYVDPAEYAPGDPTIQLLYPEQKVRKLTLRYENRGFRSFFADGLSVTGYYLKNVRDFDTNITIPFSPSAGMTIQSSNFTDIDTVGARVEMTKVLFKSHVVTYGLDFYQDSSFNTDENTTAMFGFGPPMVSTDNVSKIPNARFGSFGLFLQDDIPLFRRASMILGIRYQNIRAETKKTEGIAEEPVRSIDSTFVGAANFIYGITDNLNLVLSLGRGFRSANIPERFFQGVTPDGGGFQIRNPELKPETSLNVDIGMRFRMNNLYLEATAFRNQISDGIQIEPTGVMIGRLPEYRNVNVEKLRVQGFELMGQYVFDFGLSLMANYSRLDSKNLTNPELMFADTYGSRINVSARYTFPENLFFVEYHVRHSGDRKDVDLGVNPIGGIIPGFTVHTIRAGLTLFGNSRFPQHLHVSVENLTNRLYAEFSNSSFFRPSPGRQIVFSWTAGF